MGSYSVTIGAQSCVQSACKTEVAQRAATGQGAAILANWSCCPPRAHLKKSEEQLRGASDQRSQRSPRSPDIPIDILVARAAIYPAAAPRTTNQPAGTRTNRADCCSVFDNAPVRAITLCTLAAHSHTVQHIWVDEVAEITSQVRT